MMANVVFSVSSVTLQNKSNKEVNFNDKYTYHVTNKSRYSRKIKVALSDKTDAVSIVASKLTFDIKLSFAI